MIDHQLRKLIDPPLNAVAGRLPCSANQVSVGGFVIGLIAVPTIVTGHFWLALLCISVNRIADGLDGAIARRVGPTNFGGYLDIVLDFIFYSAVIFGFALYDKDNAPWAAFLIFSFVGTGTSFLAFAALAGKLGLTTALRGRKSIYYLGGLTEGFETIATLLLMCVFPGHFWLIAAIFGIMCWMTTATRILTAHDLLTSEGRNGT